jgi:uncharacterized protein (TIGR00375 family)
MGFIADLHIHSHFSRATSKDLTPEALWKWAQLKGITVMGTGDFTHPLWFRELREKLTRHQNGLFTLRKEFHREGVPASCASEVHFMLSAEISCIYRKHGRTRKIHSILFVPDFSDAKKISTALARIGNLNADGRPILGLDAKELLRIVMECSPDSMLVPAHAWTPHFSVFGAVSGFDSLEECFEDLTPHIYAIETGLSSDPLMNWRLSGLDRITLISNSDAHSPSKIGREANIFTTDISYASMMKALKTREGFGGTIEFFPEEGKYHYDGHRLCGVSLSPEETVQHDYLCPVCGKRVTVGVMHRVDDLSDRPRGVRPPDAPPYHSIIPLPEILSEVLKVGVNSKAVEREYFRLLELLGNEFSILIDAPLEELERHGPSLFKDAIARMRAGTVHIEPGFDGEFGKVKIFEEVRRKEVRGQSLLFKS